MAKLVEVECPRCGAKTSLPFGLVDVKTGETIDLPCPQCGFDFASQGLDTQPPENRFSQ